ncbi:hypothetical protein GBAR_LOCUS24075 [Geodia barretti]|uniref:Uncharacterized protein n=1 Tax=Geodia barretti TaxID=519541 RepID=A0AA35TAK5_GEOBA|nr:hypothetical protein GBAR_LOCUS24075 [Geodia barretti]
MLIQHNTEIESSIALHVLLLVHLRTLVRDEVGANDWRMGLLGMCVYIRVERGFRGGARSPQGDLHISFPLSGRSSGPSSTSLSSLAPFTATTPAVPGTPHLLPHRRLELQTVSWNRRTTNSRCTLQRSLIEKWQRPSRTNSVLV